jgi:very-short-patch-repair endonuclease
MDIAKVLGNKNSTQASKIIESCNRRKIKTKTPGGNKDMVFADPLGVKMLLQRCRSAHTQKIINTLSRFGVSLEVVYACKETSCMRVFEKAFRHFSPQAQYPVGDFRIDLYFPEHKIALECDENGHADRLVEAERTRQLYIEGELNCYFIRFNPDHPEFNIGDVVHEMITVLHNRISWEKYHERIADTVKPLSKACAKKNLDLCLSKPCNICKIEQPLDNFNFAKENRDGRENICRNCKRERQAKNLATKRDTMEVVVDKACKVCRITKSLENDFYKDKLAPDGHMRRCKDCHTDKQKVPKTHVVVTEKRCTSCSITKPVSDFYKSSKSPDGFTIYCLKCSQIKGRANYAKAKGKTKGTTTEDSND